MVNLGLNVFFFADENVRCRVDGDRRGLLVAALEPAITAQIYIGSPMVHSYILPKILVYLVRIRTIPLC